MKPVGPFTIALCGSTACLAAALTACAVNPLVEVRDKPTDADVPTMTSSLAKAQQLKTSYRQKAYDFVGNQVAVNDALLALGVLTRGLTASTAHADTYRTTAFGAGGLYLLGNQNFPKTRLDIYQAGVGAVNCALLASSPLQMDAAELVSIASETAATKAKLPGLLQSIARARAEQAEVAGVLDAATAQRIDDRIASVERSYASGLATRSRASCPTPTTSATSSRRSMC